MDYEYTIVQAEPKHKYLLVSYTSEGRDEYVKSFNPLLWDEEHIVEVIEQYAPEVLRHWVYQETHDIDPPIAVGTTRKAKGEPSPVDYLHDHFPAPTMADRQRMRRDAMLAETDIHALEDTKAMSAEVRKYRQALRDVTKQEGFPNKVVWPARPAELPDNPFFMERPQ